MRIVKQVFEAAGYKLLYSRNKQQPGYYLDGQPAFSPEFKQILHTSAAEVANTKSTFIAIYPLGSTFISAVPSAR